MQTIITGSQGNYSRPSREVKVTIPVFEFFLADALREEVDLRSTSSVDSFPQVLPRLVLVFNSQVQFTSWSMA